MAPFGRRGRPERRGTPFDALVVGLGNPGDRYAGTRHNVGADVVALLARRWGASLRAGRHRALEAQATTDGRRVLLAAPTTFMNDSGDAVGPLARAYGIGDAARIVVVHDELDLPPGTVRVKMGGGLAGHYGLESIERHLRTRDFVRVRIGVGKPPTKERGGEHVLARPTGETRAALDVAVEVAADAVEAIVRDGADAAMRTVNAR
ncbi:MAG: hypothetical protein RL283_1717 [Actinomycetota bacterium]|jgi:PTH1 family peptidyl-tRNA hydrolase